LTGLNAWYFTAPFHFSCHYCAFSDAPFAVVGGEEEEAAAEAEAAPW